jgi:hypothetical protein
MMAVGTMKRKLQLMAVVLTLSLLGFGTALLLWPRDRITVDSWQKIRLGMTEYEVVEILGSPGMSHETVEAQYDRLEKELGRCPFEIEDPSLMEPKGRPFFWEFVSDRNRIWNGRRGIIAIELDQENRVSWKSFQAGRWINGGILDGLRDWLGW